MGYSVTGMAGAHPRSTGGRRFPWYDARWLEQFTRATDIVKATQPEALDAFLDAFRVLRTRLDFETTVLDHPVDDDELGHIRQASASLRPGDLELAKARSFGRFMVQNHPDFVALHDRLAPVVSDLVGETVEPRYTFLSLYTALGVCPLHMDAPSAKWTLDLCVRQSELWPIHFSQVEPWPESRAEVSPEDDWEEAVRRSPDRRFMKVALEPGQAVLFSGSSQWHYREAIAGAQGRGFCDLLFFHFIPRGTGELLDPSTWAQRFGVPALAGLAAPSDGGD